MPTERIVITVKTYPQLSTKYGETVCTAGMKPDGSWVRLYPIPFRLLDLENRYRKWEIIEAPLQRVNSDFRPESHNPIDPDAIEVVGKLDRENDWQARRDLVFRSAPIHTALQPLIRAAHANECSLATFRPTEVLDFLWEPDEREWNEDKLQAMRQHHEQGELFADENWREAFRVIPKLPYRFRYVFRDADGKESRPQILDWEVGMLYWNCLKGSPSEAAALDKVRAKFIDEFANKDLHFFLGTTKGQHLRAVNPWLIVGLFYPPITRQRELGLFY